MNSQKRLCAHWSNCYLFENMPLGFYRTTPEGQILEANQMLVNLLDYPDRETLLNVNVSELYLVPKQWIEWQRFLEERTSERYFDVQLKGFKGQIVWVQNWSQIICDESSGILYYEGIVLDITARKEMELALRESEKRYCSLFEGIPDGVVVFSQGEEFLDCNKVMLQRLNYNWEEFAQLRVLDIVNPDYHAVEKDNLQRLWKGDHTVIESVHIDKMGRDIPVEVHAQCVEYQGERVILAVIRDITERKRTAISLQESGKYYRQLFEKTPDAIAIYDKQGRFLDCNQQMLDLAGYGQEEQKNIVVTNIIPTKYYDSFQQNVQRLEAGEEVVVEAVVVRKDSKEIPVEVHACQIDHNLGKVILATVRDITAHKQVEDALRQSEAKWRELYRHTPIPTYTWQRVDDDLLLIDCNETALRYTQGEASQWLGSKASVLHQDTPDILDDLEKCWTLQTTFEREMTYTFKTTGKKRELAVKYAFVPPDFILVHTEDITVRKEAEIKLRLSEGRLRQATHLARLGIWDWEIATDETTWWGEMFNIYGIAPEEFTGNGTDYIHFTHPDDKPIQQANIQKAFENAAQHFVETGETNLIEPDPKEFRIIRPDGTVCFVSGDAVAIVDDNGQPVSMLGTLIDITALKQTETNLRILSQTVEQSPVAITITDPQGVIEYVNPKFVHLTGYSFDEAIGHNPRLLKSGIISVQIYQQLWLTIMAGEEWCGELCNKKKNGDLYWVSASISPVKDEKGQIIHFVSVQEDITERKVMEDTLRKRNRELTQLNEASRTLSATLNLEEVLTSLLEEIRQFFGADGSSVWLLDKETGELVCRQVSCSKRDVVYGWRLAPRQGLVGWVAHTGESLLVTDVAQEPRHFNGVNQKTGVVMRSILSVPLRTGQGVLGVIQVTDQSVARFSEDDLNHMELLAAVAANAIENAHLHENLQEQFVLLRNAQKRLVQSEKLIAVGELVAGVAHELNNPLSSILLYSQLLQLKDINQSFKSDIEQIVSQANRASNVVKGLLDFARQRPPTRQTIQINDILQSTFNLLAYELRSHGVETKISFQEDLPLTEADPHQLQQTFVNLINNAAYAMYKEKERGQLYLKTELAAPTFPNPQPKASPILRIIIQDNGVGISADVLPRIFDPFFTTKELGEGTGLGLSVCHGIIHEHGGHIWAESVLGKGSTFFIELPVISIKEREQPSIVTSEPTDDSKEFQRILVVDDEKSLSLVIQRALHKAGYSVDVVNDAVNALLYLEENPYDLILCDILMPELSGPEFYKQIQLHFPHLVKRIVFMTGDTVSPLTQQFFTEVDPPYLSKPFEFKTLISTVQSHLDVLSSI